MIFPSFHPMKSPVKKSPSQVVCKFHGFPNVKEAPREQGPSSQGAGVQTCERVFPTRALRFWWIWGSHLGHTWVIGVSNMVISSIFFGVTFFWSITCFLRVTILQQIKFKLWIWHYIFNQFNHEETIWSHSVSHQIPPIAGVWLPSSVLHPILRMGSVFFEARKT